MNIETPELRGRIISTTIFLEDELDTLILTFMSPHFEPTEHCKSSLLIIKNHFILGKTFGKKVQLVNEILNSVIFEKEYYKGFLSFLNANNITTFEEYNTYNSLKNYINSTLKKVNQIRNIVAHGKINYDILMSMDEIKNRDREFIHNERTVKISKNDEIDFNKNVSNLSFLIQTISTIIIMSNYERKKE